jgi:hypothetical protein
MRTEDFKRGGFVTWTSGPGWGMPSGGVCRGRVCEVSAALGVFVETEGSVPILLGRGTDMEYYTSGDGLWVRPESISSYAPPLPWQPKVRS